MTRRHLWIICAASIACAGAPTSATYQGGDSRETLAIGSWDRSYRIHLPMRTTPGPLAPLILAYHGLGQTAAQLEATTGLDDVADAAGFIVVYPEAALGQWDVTGDFVDLFGIDDLAFARTLIDRMSNEFVIDRHRVYAAGLSNGAVFAERLACEMTDQLAGFIAVAGTLSRAGTRRLPSVRPDRRTLHHRVARHAVPGRWRRRRALGRQHDGILAGAESLRRPRYAAHTPRHCPRQHAGLSQPVPRLRERQDRTRQHRRIGPWLAPGALVPANGISRNLSANAEIRRFIESGRARPR